MVKMAQHPARTQLVSLGAPSPTFAANLLAVGPGPGQPEAGKNLGSPQWLWGGVVDMIRKSQNGCYFSIVLL